MNDNWWVEKIRSEMPQAPPPPRYENIAPGAWWQGQEQQQQASRLPPAAHQTPPLVPDTESCPHCGGDNYIEMTIDAQFGGHGGQVKRCFDCRYPQFDASGDVYTSKGMNRRQANLAGAKTNFTRQTAGSAQGSWQGDATFDAAVKIA